MCSIDLFWCSLWLIILLILFVSVVLMWVFAFLPVNKNIKYSRPTTLCRRIKRTNPLNGVARNYKNRFWWHFAEIFKRLYNRVCIFQFYFCQMSLKSSLIILSSYRPQTVRHRFDWTTKGPTIRSYAQICTASRNFWIDIDVIECHYRGEGGAGDACELSYIFTRQADSLELVLEPRGPGFAT